MTSGHFFSIPLVSMAEIVLPVSPLGGFGLRILPPVDRISLSYLVIVFSTNFFTRPLCYLDQMHRREGNELTGRTISAILTDVMFLPVSPLGVFGLRILLGGASGQERTDGNDYLGHTD